MTLEKLAEDYCFHDSTVCEINRVEGEDKLLLDIWFCIWMQNWADKYKEKNGVLRLTFSGNAETDFPFDEKLSVYDILECDLKDGKIVFMLSHWLWEEPVVKEFSISGDDVEAEFISFDYPWEEK